MSKYCNHKLILITTIIFYMPKVIPEYRDEARKKIIASGYEVMSLKGYCNTTLDDIANHVGVSKTTLYLYFSNKEDLIIEIIRSVHTEVHETAEELFSTKPMLEAYEHLLELFIGRDLERIGFTYDVLALSSRNPVIRKIHQEHTQHIMEHATRGIICLQQRGFARTDVDPRTIAMLLISLISGLTSLILKGVDKEEVKGQFHEMGGIILGITSEEQ